MSKETTDNATPRPWAACDDRPDGELCIVTGDENRLPIAMVDTQNTGDDQATADAALIVAAVNSRDALVAACRAVRQELDDLHLAIADQGIEARFIDDRVNMLSEGRTAIERADAALALAGE